MESLTLKKKFEFSACHKLTENISCLAKDSPCKRMHGHNYVGEAVIQLSFIGEGPNGNGAGHPYGVGAKIIDFSLSGMLVDFSDVKRILMRFDHGELPVDMTVERLCVSFVQDLYQLVINRLLCELASSTVRFMLSITVGMTETERNYGEYSRSWEVSI